jgi:hypothetical protein
LPLLVGILLFDLLTLGMAIAAAIRKPGRPQTIVAVLAFLATLAAAYQVARGRPTIIAPLLGTVMVLVLGVRLIPAEHDVRRIRARRRRVDDRAQRKERLPR